jgi:hypothetical protein
MRVPIVEPRPRRAKAQLRDPARVLLGQRVERLDVALPGVEREQRRRVAAGVDRGGRRSGGGFEMIPGTRRVVAPARRLTGEKVRVGEPAEPMPGADIDVLVREPGELLDLARPGEPRHRGRPAHCGAGWQSSRPAAWSA